MHLNEHLQIVGKNQILACEMDANLLECFVGITGIYWRWQRRKCVTCNMCRNAIKMYAYETAYPNANEYIYIYIICNI